MPIDWKTQESYSRLLAALVAASDNSIDYKKVAYFFGQGATYDAIEGRFRIAKRMANDLKQEAENEGRQMPSTSRVKSANSTPRKPKAKANSEHAVASGRVQKSPSKKRGGVKASPSKLKDEPRTPTSLDGDDHDSLAVQQPQHRQQQLSHDADAFEHSSSYIYGTEESRLFNSFDTEPFEA
ncbi:hypothetical protein SLS54_008538 [Diplodia seriata]